MKKPTLITRLRKERAAAVELQRNAQTFADFMEAYALVPQEFLKTEEMCLRAALHNAKDAKDASAVWIEAKGRFPVLATKAKEMCGVK